MWYEEIYNIYLFLCFCFYKYKLFQFLDEESYGSTTDIFNDESGLKALANLSYTKMYNLWRYGCFCLTSELGTDLFLRSGNTTDIAICDYYGLDAMNSNVSTLWNHCYKALANCNMFLKGLRIPLLPMKQKKLGIKLKC